MQKRGPYKPGLQRRTEIIEAARTLFLEEGYHNFSLRKVAKIVGISAGNLQHHFASRDELIEEMLNSVISYHIQRLKGENCIDNSAKKYLYNVIKYIVSDLSTRETTLFFPELWSLANHDKNVDKMMQNMYHSVQELYQEIALSINPKLTLGQTKNIALFIVASVEGHTMFLGNQKPYISHAEATLNMVYGSALQLIESGNIPE